MSWINAALDQLAACKSWGYTTTSVPASEPTALAALALASYDRTSDARRATNWLAGIQNSDGSVGITAADKTPGWPTSQAVLAWSKVDGVAHAANLRRGSEWLLRAEGVALEHTPALGHDPTIVGWPWVLSTHSWLEPTAWALIALRATGNSDNARYREGVRLLLDRLLPTGGANYGNTFVLGQKLRPQIEPTGLAVVALGGARDASGRLDASIKYLRSSVNEQTPGVSLAYGLMGLAAQDAWPSQAETFLESAYQRSQAQQPEPLKLSLLLLAARANDCPLLEGTFA